ncbi:MAG: penicillin-binding transpeptidase domain-containing protein [Christensenellales bacterium]|jgi:peptidoglycan glycosyltransferase
MRAMQRNIKSTATLLLAMMVALLAYFCYAVGVYGNTWFMDDNNLRLKAGRTSIIMGSITDRNGQVLASSKDFDSPRSYADDKTLRMAGAHLIGDDLGMTSGGAQTLFTRYLLGFNSSWVDRLIETFTGNVPHGDSVALTVDARLQKTAYEALGGRAGAVVVLNYKTGEVLASVSSPSFDPAALTADWADAAPEGTFVNRVTQGKYPPGSVFKLITASAMLKDPDFADAEFDCTGATDVDGHTVKCYNGTAHGRVDLSKALSVSCNGAFARWAYDLGAGALTREAEAFGFNDEFLFRDCVVYDSQFVYPEDSFELAWSGVGQSKTLMTPMHAAMIAAGIANDGVIMEPRLMLRAESFSGRSFDATRSRVYRTVMSAAAADELAQMMRLGVESGSATAARIKGYDVCGKTGTAEVGAGKTPHAWFTGFIDDKEAPYAVAVVVDHGGTGNAAAAPVAQKVLLKCIEIF